MFLEPVEVVAGWEGGIISIEFRAGFCDFRVSKFNNLRLPAYTCRKLNDDEKSSLMIIDMPLC